VLQDGATIGIVAPSSGVAALCPRRFLRGLAHLEELGLTPVVGDTATAQSHIGYTSATPQERADDLNRMFADSRISAIMTTIGGTAANHILDHLDVDVIASNPKFLIGYSDVTLLHAALWQRVGLTSISGPALLPQFGEPDGPHSFTRQNFLRVVATSVPPGRIVPSGVVLEGVRHWDLDDDLKRLEAPAPAPWVHAEGVGHGWLAPVNIESLLALSGTDWYPDLSGALLVLEAAETTSAARFHQGLHQLKAQHVFQTLAGLLIGRFDTRSQCPPDLVSCIVDDVLGKPDFPVVSGIDFGHTDPLLSLPWGVAAEISATSGEDFMFSILEAAGSSPAT
jgi:muramoyltetrapeptide carboxypeptidase